jgi:hypothetical protein
VTYEVWSKTSRSALGAFSTEGGAVAAVREAVEVQGRDYGLTLAVIREDSRGGSTPVAEGEELVEKALDQPLTLVRRWDGPKPSSSILMQCPEEIIRQREGPIWLVKSHLE